MGNSASSDYVNPRSQDPVETEVTSFGTWCYFCSENTEGSGWRSSFSKPRSEPGRGDIVGYKREYSVDESFSSRGSSPSDVVEYVIVYFGFPHNELFGAAIDGKLNDVKHLLNMNNINDQLNIGNRWTALHGAVFYNQLEVVEYLLQKGADFRIRDTQGYSPLTLATILKFNQCIKLLRKYITDPADLEKEEKEINEEKERVEIQKENLINRWN